ncbi:MAG: cyanophycinase [Planctomycetaceae bacterium]|nr:cyanophycinase [Planctomycetaceae bacterium]
MLIRIAAVLGLLLSNGSLAFADQPATLSQIDGIKGALLIVGGGAIPEDAQQAFRAMVGDNGSVAILPDASDSPDEAAKQAIEWLGKSGFTDSARLIVVKAGDAQSIETLSTADGVWICGGQQQRLADAWKNTNIEEKLLGILERGGVVAGTSAGAAIMSKVMIAGGNPVPDMSKGWDLLPGAIVDQHFSERQRLPRLQEAVSNHGDCVGLGIDEGTALLCRGRMMKVLGAGTVTACLLPCSWRHDELQVLKSGEMADLTQLRRAARQRYEKRNPGIAQSGPVKVESGSLVIVGGGGMPPEVVSRFVELAGGENAHIVVLPTAVPRDQTDSSVPGFLKRASIAKVTVLTQRTSEVESAEFQEAMKSATGIWFGGGRQWNFVDAYEGTTAVAAFHDVLKRGGVIAGSSAGATIQGEFLVRGHPLGNTIMMADGYERGFAFLPGSAVDQHFAQRQRFADLLPVVWTHPQMLGIGIDEATALVVKGTHADVIGQSAVHFVTRPMLDQVSSLEALPRENGEAQKFYRTVKTGESIDLATLPVQAKP